MLKKYWTLFQISWQNGLAYPLSFFLWRFRQLLSVLMPLTLWSLIFANQTSAFGYDQSQMISYIFLVSLLQGAVLSTSLHGLASDIYSGKVSQLLIKPLSFFSFAAAQELADKLKNVVMTCVEMAVLYLLFRPEIAFPGWEVFGLFVVWVALGIILHFYIEILFGTMGFWSPQTWAPKFLFFVLVDATAGKLFPLDILPEAIQKLIYLTPFPYLAYIQTQIFLGRLSSEQILQYSFGLVGWTVGVAVLATFVWRKGIKSYSAAGG